MGSVELKRWRDAMIADRDDLLIAAARRWLGPIKTPFNKHDLLSRLEAYLRRPASSAAMVELMDARDRLAVTALMTLGDLPPALLAELCSTGAPETRAATGPRHLANLRERLIVYRYRNGRGRERVALVPPLADALGGEFAQAGFALAAPEAVKPFAVEDPWAVICALVSACARVRPVFKTNLEFTKKARELLARSAPAIEDGTAPAGALLGRLMGAGILFMGEDGLPAVDVLRFERVARAFGDGTPLALACAPDDGDQPLVGPVRRRAFLDAFLGAMPRWTAYGEADFSRLSLAAAWSFLTGLAADGDVELAALLEDDDGGLAMELSPIEPLSLLGILRKLPDARWVLAAEPRPESKRPPIVVEESHEIKVLPEADAYIRAYLAAVGRIEGTDLVWSVMLDKEAALSAFAAGFDAAGIGATLERYSGKSLPQSIRFSLEAWEAQSRGVRVFEGIVARLDAHHAAMLEHSPKAEGAVREKLAEGVFLLEARSLRDAEKALRRAGIHAELRQEPHPDAARDGAGFDALLAAAEAGSAGEAVGAARPALPDGLLRGAPPGPGTAAGAGRAVAATAVPPAVERLMRALDGMELAPQARAVLADRIRSRLVLSEDQLSAQDLGVDPGAAGALDYPGKVRVLERAVREGEAVELALPGQGASPAVLMGRPVALRKTSGGLMVTIRTPAGDDLPVSVGAIQKLRTIHTDLFGA